MISRIQAAALLVAGACALCLAANDLKSAAGDPKPACDAATAGHLWPEAANHDSKLRQQFSHCGELELCTLAKRRYRWKLMTVRIDQLRGGSGSAKPAGCEVLDATREEDPAGGHASSPPR
jgi:hypothetical protein